MTSCACADTSDLFQILQYTQTYKVPLHRTNLHEVRNVHEFEYTFLKRKYYFFPQYDQNNSNSTKKPLDTSGQKTWIKICKGLKSATLIKAKLFHRHFLRFSDRKCIANSLDITEQLFCRAPFYVGQFFLNVTTLWNIF